MIPSAILNYLNSRSSYQSFHNCQKFFRPIMITLVTSSSCLSLFSRCSSPPVTLSSTTKIAFIHFDFPGEKLCPRTIEQDSHPQHQYNPVPKLLQLPIQKIQKKSRARFSRFSQTKLFHSHRSARLEFFPRRGSDVVSSTQQSIRPTVPLSLPINHRLTLNTRAGHNSSVPSSHFTVRSVTEEMSDSS